MWLAQFLGSTRKTSGLTLHLQVASKEREREYAVGDCWVAECDEIAGKLNDLAALARLDITVPKD